MFVNHLRYHKRRLPPAWQPGYDAVERAVVRMDSHFEIDARLPYARPDAIWNVLVAVYNDNPSYYYFTPTQYSTGEVRDTFVVSLKYLYLAQEARGLEQVLTNFMKRFYRAHVKLGMSDDAKVRLIYNFLVSTIVYDEQSARDPNGGDLDVYNVLGALLKRRAVCWGIAMSFKLLCDYLEVPCIVVPGWGGPAGQSERHAWNMVRLDGEFYHVDATWDLRTGGIDEDTYNYLNVDDRSIGGDHDWDRTFYPACDGRRHNPFAASGALLEGIEQVGPFCHRMLAKGAGRVVFKFTGAMPDAETIDNEIQRAVQDFLRRNDLERLAWQCRVDRIHKNVYLQLPK